MSYMKSSFILYLYTNIKPNENSFEIELGQCKHKIVVNPSCTFTFLFIYLFIFIIHVQRKVFDTLVHQRQSKLLNLKTLHFGGISLMKERSENILPQSFPNKAKRE